MTQRESKTPDRSTPHAILETIWDLKSQQCKQIQAKEITLPLAQVGASAQASTLRTVVFS
jgi:hypothetical protein